MASVFNKEIRRSITHSIGRFLAIAIIAALGCGFYAGLRMTPVDMNLSADEFYDATNMSDLYVTGTLGLDDADVAAIANVEGVRSVEPVRMGDAYVGHSDAKIVIRFNSLDLAAAYDSDTADGWQALSDDDAYINRPVLVEGTWPSAPGECVIAADAVLDVPMHIGETLEVVGVSGEIDATFERTNYVITGFVRSPYYVMTSDFGATDLGSGTIDTYAFVAADDFSPDYPYTGAFVTIDGAADELFPSASYDSVVQTVIDRLEGMSLDFRVSRLQAVKAEAQEEIDDARATYENERASAMAQLDDAAAQLAQARDELDVASQTIAQNTDLLNASEQELAVARDQLVISKEELDAKKAELDAGMLEYQKQQAELDDARIQAEAAFAFQQAQIDLIPDEAKRLEAQQALDVQKAQTMDRLDAADVQLGIAKEQLDAGSAQLHDGMRLYDEGVARLNVGEQAYEQGRAALAHAQEQYARGVSDYESGWAAYQSNRDVALRELADGKAKIDDAQSDIDSIELPDFYVLDRSKNIGAAGREADASRIDQIARVFPLIFFLVAALVALTTMTRMVDEERMLIGTYKALGYSNARIISKYLIYALVASGVGSLVGIMVLSIFLPQFIMNAYSIIYAIPVSVSPIDISIAAMAFALSVGITLVATWFAAMSSLRERPALLMLPRAPKPGKRILLERIAPLWRRLSFSSKVTARNIFRYKRRFFMAVIGIAGCTALLLTGLGLHDGINDIIEKQFGEIQYFNLEVQVSDDQEARDTQKLDSVLEDSSIVTETMRVADENVISSREGSASDVRTQLIVPKDLDQFADFYTLRQRVGHGVLSLDNSGAVITEKLASELDVSVGDAIEVYDQSTVGERIGAPHVIRISGIAEYYTGQRIFMTPDYFEQVMEKPPLFTMVISKADAPLDERTALANEVLDIGGVEVVSYYDEIIDTYRTMLQTVNAVVLVLIVAAALLAFVVLYNLTNINITERTREIATLKVLGFTSRETNAYIFRETLILTIIGALLGCVLGIWMEGFVVVTAEVDQMMFGRDIHIMSFIAAFALTMVFSIIVSLAMAPKIRSINMVESLKSVD